VYNLQVLWDGRMTMSERLRAICAGMSEQKLDVIVALHDGAHFIETPNPVMVLTGFKSIGPAAATIWRDGAMSLIVTPAWDRDRGSAACPDIRVVAADDPIDGLAACLVAERADKATVGVAGLSFVSWRISRRLIELLPNAATADCIIDGAAAVKTEEEIAHAREAARIAEGGYQRLLEIAAPGVSEDELAVELKWHSKTLGAEDNFLLLCAGAHHRAVAPSNGRRLQASDIVLAEITPSYCGQLAQICRTVVLGSASPTLAEKYQLVVRAMMAGIDAARPGVPMSAVCRAINAMLEAEGYGAFCYPPHIRRRGHGLGFGSIAPGDVSLENDAVLAPGMVFVIHPNQYLPETGYLLCGEPVVMTPEGARPLTRECATLAEIGM
jgi:Xaa-Pro aminopeptidase